jgi:hypothetical protein
MVRYLSIDNKHPKIDFARKCSFKEEGHELEPRPLSGGRSSRRGIDGIQHNDTNLATRED